MTTSALEITQGFPKITMYDDILDRCRLSKLAYARSVNLDLHLSIALVEHWNQDYYSFHLPMDEMIVTLLDVY